MEYVMVPVPEKYVERLKQELLRIGIEQAMAVWEADDVAEMLRDLEDDPRALLTWLALARVNDLDTSVGMAARALHCTPAEVMVRRAEVNRWPTARGRSEVVFHDTRPTNTPAGPGDPRDDLMITPHVAALVVAALRDGS